MILFFLAMHDVGKFSVRFQGLDADLLAKLQNREPAGAYEPRHDTLGSIALRRHLIPRVARQWAQLSPGWSENDWRDFLEAWEPAFTGHHGQPPRADVLGDPWAPDDIAALIAYAEEVLRILGLDADPPVPLLDPDDAVRAATAASWHFAGLAVLCDWIGSDEEQFRARDSPVPLDSYWQHDARTRAEQAVSDAGVLPVAPTPWRGVSALFDLKAPRPMQKAVDELSVPGDAALYIVEDATGSGKTEAAFGLAHRIMQNGGAEGVYVGLPTMATANAMYGRLRRYAHRLFKDPGSASLVLAHSGKLALNEFRKNAVRVSPRRTGSSPDEDESLACAAWLADNRKKALLAHVGVGTVDQALIGVLPVRHQALRLFGVTSKVLIIDEVHAYDQFTTRLIETLIRFQARAGASTILLTATLPRTHRARFVRAHQEALGKPADDLQTEAFPLITMSSAAGVVENPVPSRPEAARRVEIVFHEGPAEAEQVVRQAHEDGLCVCWIRNTVDEATGAWDRLRDLGPTLIHSRFTEADRRRIEQELLEWAGPPKDGDSQRGRKGRVVVSTQVVEQSLDVDFDVLVTDLAPIDILIQRLGRLQRHDRGTRVPLRLHVQGPSWSEEPEAEWVRRWSPGTAAVYPDPGLLWLTFAHLRRTPTVHLPADSRSLMESVYGANASAHIPAGLARAHRQAETEERAKRSRAIVDALRLESGYRRSDHWDDEVRASTRLGLLQTDVYLAVRDADGRLMPLMGLDDGWDGSRLRIALRYAEDWPEAEDFAKRSEVPSHMRRGRILVMDPDAAGWRAAPAKNQVVRYDRTRGLTMEKSEEDR